MIAVNQQYLFHQKYCQEPLTSDSDEENAKNPMFNPNQKLKNQLCKNYLNLGYCKYHNRCQFAHGIVELRQNLAINSKYKTKECHSYFSKGHCIYGERCNFVHKKAEINDEKKRVLSEIDWELKFIKEGSRSESRFFKNQ